MRSRKVQRVMAYIVRLACAVFREFFDAFHCARELAYELGERRKANYRTRLSLALITTLSKSSEQQKTCGEDEQALPNTSQYTMKHRIKVVVDKDATPDGETARAWLQYDTDSENTIKECRRAFARQLGLQRPDELELFIEGKLLARRHLYNVH